MDVIMLCLHKKLDRPLWGKEMPLEILLLAEVCWFFIEAQIEENIR